MFKRYLKYLLVLSIALGVGLFGLLFSHNMNVNDAGLSLLGWVKKAKGNAVDVEEVYQVYSSPIDHSLWSVLLEEHVDESGDVDYEGFLKEKSRLEDYLKLISEHPPSKTWSDEVELAYWINAYNAFTIKLILNHYPLESIKDISDGLLMINSPWDIKFFNIGDIPFDLNTIEHDILRKRFNEPRIHFAINCASISCPVLLNVAYESEHLDRQLEEQTAGFINDSSKNMITEDVMRLSLLFSWFKSDFTKEEGLFSFLQKYRANLKLKNQIEYMDYNWGLNIKR
jgi:hypothetical protein